VRRRLRPLIAALLLGAVGGSGGCAPAHAPGERPAHAAAPAARAGEAAALEARQASFLAAMSARDAEALTAHFAADAVLHVGGMPAVEGRDAIARFYGNVFRFLQATDPTAGPPRLADGGGMAYTLGRVANTFGGADGPVRHEGKFLLVWERRTGEWQVVVYGVSNDRPDPGR
jgi:ketosteroid isomerase-like protein